MTLAAPWRTLRGRLVLAAVAGLVTAAVVFAVVGAGLIRSQSQAVARGELDRQARALARIVSAQAERAAQRGVEFQSDYRPDALEALVGPEAKIYYTGLELTPGAEQPTGGFPSIAAEELDYEVLEERGRPAHRLPSAGRRRHLRGLRGACPPGRQRRGRRAAGATAGPGSPPPGRTSPGG